MSWISAPVARITAVMRTFTPMITLVAALCAIAGSQCAFAADTATRVEAPADGWTFVVLNAGQTRSGRSLASSNATSFVQPASFTFGDEAILELSPADRAAWSLQLGMVRPPHVYRTHFGPTSGIPVAGDFNGDGLAEIGMYVAGNWRLDLNGNSQCDAADLTVQLGDAGHRPIVGDWDGDGKDDIGVVRREPGSAPVVGDFDGDGRIDRGQFSDGVWTLRCSGRQTSPELIIRLGLPGDRPIVGDFNRDGRDELGIYRRGLWHIDTSGDRRLGDDDLRLTLGDDSDTPVVGDWDGDGRDQIGIVHRGSGS